MIRPGHTVRQPLFCLQSFVLIIKLIECGKPRGSESEVGQKHRVHRPREEELLFR